MTALTILLVVGCLAYGFWDGWCRYLKHKERVQSLVNQRQDILLTQLSELSGLLNQSISTVDASVEKNRAILKGFIDSMTDIVKISEEDKQSLQNRLVASKLGMK